MWSKGQRKLSAEKHLSLWVIFPCCCSEITNHFFENSNPAYIAPKTSRKFKVRTLTLCIQEYCKGEIITHLLVVWHMLLVVYFDILCYDLERWEMYSFIKGLNLTKNSHVWKYEWTNNMSLILHVIKKYDVIYAHTKCWFSVVAINRNMIEVYQYKLSLIRVLCTREVMPT